jgi:hypothetical protein
MKRRFYAILFLLIIPIGLSATDIASWRTPDLAELGHDSSWRKEDPDLYLMAKADFDGDGKEDVARLLINDKENKMGLFVTLSYKKKAEPLLLEAIDDKNTIEVMGVEVAKPGTYKTACGKGYWTCKKGEPAQLRLHRPGIDFFRFESANSYFIWRKDKKKFERIWMSD